MKNLIKLSGFEVSRRSLNVFLGGLVIGIFFIISLLFESKTRKPNWFNYSEVDNCIRLLSFLFILVYPFVTLFIDLITYKNEFDESSSLPKVLLEDIFYYILGGIFGSLAGGFVILIFNLFNLIIGSFNIIQSQILI